MEKVIQNVCAYILVQEQEGLKSDLKLGVRW